MFEMRTKLVMVQKESLSDMKIRWCCQARFA